MEKTRPPCAGIFAIKLKERRINPHVPSTTVSGGSNLYKIKLRELGYRLVYSVSDTTVTFAVLAVEKRNHNEIYDVALSREMADKP